MKARAVLFDLDATLVDSEGQTDAVIEQVMARHGMPGVVLPPDQTRGRTWGDIVAALLDGARRLVALSPEALERQLVDAWGESVDGMRPIPGAPRALREAKAAVGRVAVVSSSPRALVERILSTTLAARDAVDLVIGADDVAVAKPAPECWLRAARGLAVEPDECVVFEDSRAGLTAARAAGIARRVLVLHRCGEPDACRELATMSIEHYDALPDRYWSAWTDA